MLNKILLALVVIVVAAGLVFGGLFVVSLLQPKAATPPATTTARGPNLSKDYGACTLNSVEEIKTALGTAASSLEGPYNDGIVASSEIGYDVEGLVSDSQACVYPFSSGGTFDNGFNAGNGLTVDVTVYSNSGGPSAFIAAIQQAIQKGAPITSIPAISDSAFYTVNTAASGPGATHSFRLQVFKGDHLTTYTLSQPAEATTFTAASAKTALVTLVR